MYRSQVKEIMRKAPRWCELIERDTREDKEEVMSELRYICDMLEIELLSIVMSEAKKWDEQCSVFD